MTREEAIAEVNRVFDYIDENKRWASGFACVAVHHPRTGAEDVTATTGMLHANGMGPLLMAGIEALIVDAHPKLTAPPRRVH